MRKLEYLSNTQKSLFGKLYLNYLTLKYRKVSKNLGFSIPINVFGPGLAIAHYGTIVINKNVRVGKNCRLHTCTNIGASGGSEKAPHIGDNVYIAPGAKIFGDIKIASNIAIAANAAVGKSFEEENIMIGGVPAKKIKNIEITSLIKHAQ
jgi:serine O-acetyltransferase